MSTEHASSSSSPNPASTLSYRLTVMKQREKSYDVDPTPAPGDVKSEDDSSQQRRQNSSDPYFGLHFHCFSTLSVRLAQGVILVLHPE